MQDVGKTDVGGRKDEWRRVAAASYVGILVGAVGLDPTTGDAHARLELFVGEKYASDHQKLGVVRVVALESHAPGLPGTAHLLHLRFSRTLLVGKI